MQKHDEPYGDSNGGSRITGERDVEVWGDEQNYKDTNFVLRC